MLDKSINSNFSLLDYTAKEIKESSKNMDETGLFQMIHVCTLIVKLNLEKYMDDVHRD